MTRIPGLQRVFRLAAAPRVDEDVDAELAFHFDMTVQRLVAEGRTPEEARREAEQRFGDVPATRARLRDIDRRREGEARRSERLAGLWQDVRYAARGLRASPGFTAVVVLTLALGIGANATMFGIVDRLLLRPPAYLHDAHETGRVYHWRTEPGEGERLFDRYSFARYLDLRDNTRAFAQLAATYSTESVMGMGEEARQVQLGYVSANLWSMFDARPALGRFFGPDEDRDAGGAPVLVLSHALWKSSFGGDSAVLGRALRIGPTTYTVIGVAPPEFSGVDITRVDAWAPMSVGAANIVGPEYRTTYRATWLQIVGRRKPGVAAAAADADLAGALRRTWLNDDQARPVAMARPRAELGSILMERGPRRGESSKVATWLGGVSLIVLLIACANVANLLLARALRRQREIAVRVALGVSRGRLLGQLVVESVLLALLGGAAALAVARVGGGVLRAVLLPDVAWSTAPVDGRTLGYTALAAIATGLLTGIVPAVQASRPDLTGALKAGAREGHLKRSRTRATLLVLQAAMSVVLLVGAGLFVRSLENVRNLDLGYDPDRVAFATVDLRGTTLTPAERRALHQRMLDRLASMREVERAGTTLTLPFYMNMDRDLYVPGIDSVGALGTFYLNAVRGDYFGAMGTRIVRGRAIDDRDRAGAALAIVVSETMARLLWPGRDALGQCVKVGADTPCSTVVGVARDITRGDLRGEAATQYYIAADQMVARRNGAENGLVIRVRGDVGIAKERLRRALQPLAPGAAYVDVVSLQSFIDPEVRPWRLGATMFGAFGVLALLLSAVGLYSVIAYNVAQRTHELGVRVALGARTGDVVRLVLGEGVRVAVVGISLGLLAALWAGRYVAALLFEISPRDPTVLGVVSVALLAVAVAASLVPALRASRVDPNLALRAE